MKGVLMELRSIRLAWLACGLAVSFGGPPTGAVTLPDGFQEQVMFTGLTQPTAIGLAPDGRVFIAEKGGAVKVFDFGIRG